jgi:hypothetical protein
MKMSVDCWRFLADIAIAKEFRDMMHALVILEFERERREGEKSKGRQYKGMSRADYRRVWSNMKEPGYLDKIDNQLEQRGKIILSAETQNDEQMLVGDGGSDSESVDRVSGNVEFNAEGMVS